MNKDRDYWLALYIDTRLLLTQLLSNTNPTSAKLVSWSLQFEAHSSIMRSWNSGRESCQWWQADPFVGHCSITCGRLTECSLWSHCEGLKVECKGVEEAAYIILNVGISESAGIIRVQEDEPTCQACRCLLERWNSASRLIMLERDMNNCWRCWKLRLLCKNNLGGWASRAGQKPTFKVQPDFQV